MGGLSKYAKIRVGVDKNEIWNMESWSITLMLGANYQILKLTDLIHRDA